MPVERDTWDQKQGRAIRGLLASVSMPPGRNGSRGGDPIGRRVRVMMEAWDRQEEAARQRSSEEMHEELDRGCDGG
jgi:hypothetical protein